MSAKKFPFLPILALIFIVAKLWGVVTWSWWVVLCPIWIPAFVVITLILLIGIGVLLGKRIK